MENRHAQTDVMKTEALGSLKYSINGHHSATFCILKDNLGFLRFCYTVVGRHDFSFRAKNLF